MIHWFTLSMSGISMKIRLTFSELKANKQIDSDGEDEQLVIISL